MALLNYGTFALCGSIPGNQNCTHTKMHLCNEHEWKTKIAALCIKYITFEMIRPELHTKKFKLGNNSNEFSVCVCLFEFLLPDGLFSV